MADEEEWERILMRRESETHRKKAEKAVLRDEMLRTKTRGYSSIGKADMPLLKVLAGYLSGTKMLHSPGVLDAVCFSISRATFAVQARKVMSHRLDDADAIVRTLRGHGGC